VEVADARDEPKCSPEEATEDPLETAASLLAQADSLPHNPRAGAATAKFVPYSTADGTYGGLPKNDRTAGDMDVPQGWRYKKGGEDRGPVSYTELQKMARSGRLADDDPVYSPTVGRWVNAWEVTGLFDLAAGPTGPEAADVDTAARARRNRILLLAIAVDVVVTAIVAIVLIVVSR
jgi:hypothetical protein